MRTYATATAEEVEDLRQATIEFCKAEITPEVAARTDAENSFPNELWKKMGDAGLLGITPQRSTAVSRPVIWPIVLLWRSSRVPLVPSFLSAHSQLCINQLSLHATKKQADKYLPDLISGRKIGALAMSEAGSGSDVVSMRTRADPTDDGSGYVLNGTKMWIATVRHTTPLSFTPKLTLPPAQRGSLFIYCGKGNPWLFLVHSKLDRFDNVYS